MGDKTAIEWADATWNPIAGCSHVSSGCDRCYAANLVAGRLSGRSQYAGLASREPGEPAKFTGEIRLLPERLDQPLRWARPRRIFVNSMSDLFHADVPRDYLDEAFAVMALCDGTRRNKRDHIFQVLTKRPGRMRLYLSGPDTPFRIAAAVCKRTVGFRPARGGLDWRAWEPWPVPNVWLGVSVEDQHAADVRIPELLRVPAAVRFLSVEPLLGPVDLAGWLYGRWRDDPLKGQLHWVIVGGESGPDARPMDPDWARSIRDQCVTAGVPFLFKQWGGRTAKAGGRELDGRTWDEYPDGR